MFLGGTFFAMTAFVNAGLSMTEDVRHRLERILISEEPELLLKTLVGVSGQWFENSGVWQAAGRSDYYNIIKMLLAKDTWTYVCLDDYPLPDFVLVNVRLGQLCIFGLFVRDREMILCGYAAAADYQQCRNLLVKVGDGKFKTHLEPVSLQVSIESSPSHTDERITLRLVEQRPPPPSYDKVPPPPLYDQAVQYLSPAHVRQLAHRGPPPPYVRTAEVITEENK